MAVGAEAPSLLAGLIVDSDGSRMTPTHAAKKAKRYRYYVSASLLKIVETTKRHEREQRPLWDLLKLFHHCSLSLVGPRSWDRRD